MTARRVAEPLRRNFGDVREVVIKGAGHTMMTEQPDPVARSLFYLRSHDEESLTAGKPSEIDPIGVDGVCEPARSATFDIYNKEPGRCPPGSYVFAAYKKGQLTVVVCPVQGLVAQAAQMLAVHALRIDHREAIIIVEGDESATW